MGKIAVFRAYFYPLIRFVIVSVRSRLPEFAESFRPNYIEWAIWDVCAPWIEISSGGKAQIRILSRFLIDTSQKEACEKSRSRSNQAMRTDQRAISLFPNATEKYWYLCASYDMLPNMLGYLSSTLQCIDAVIGMPNRHGHGVSSLGMIT